MGLENSNHSAGVAGEYDAGPEEEIPVGKDCQTCNLEILEGEPAEFYSKGDDDDFVRHLECPPVCKRCGERSLDNEVFCMECLEKDQKEGDG